MKLLTKSSLYFLGMMLPVVALGFIAFIFHFGSLLDEELDEGLYFKKLEIVAFMEHAALPEDLPGMIVSSKRVESGLKEDILSDTTMYNALEGEELPYRKLVFTTKGHDGGTYKVQILGPAFEREDLYEAVAVSVVFMVLGILAVSFTVNRVFNRWLWRPFQKTMQRLDGLKMNNLHQKFDENSGIEEFDKLGYVLNNVAARLNKEFEAIKEFTEDAAHEIQTPLAVIQSKVDGLFMGKELSEGEAQNYQAILRNVQRLSRLNKALLLMAKIGNRQFEGNARTDMSGLLDKRLEDVAELLTAKGLEWDARIEPGVSVHLHPMLAETLVDNLLFNAIKYTDVGGKVEVELSARGLKVSNSGTPFPFDGNELFGRFVKADPSQESTGLGLSIVKSIATEANMGVGYDYLGGRHVFSIFFEKKSV